MMKYALFYLKIETQIRLRAGLCSDLGDLSATKTQTGLKKAQGGLEGVRKRT